jgi:hypothetical protein
MNSFKLLEKLRVRNPKLFRPSTKKEDEKQKEYLDGEPPMKKFRDWLKERKLWPLWILIFYLAIVFTNCSDFEFQIEIKYKYNNPEMLKWKSSNK